MSNQISIHLNQIAPTTTEATIRNHKILIDRPEAKGGTNQGPMGGELLLAALGGCFLSNLYAAIIAREATISNVTVDVAGTMEANPSRFSAISLNISGDYEDRDQMEKLVTIAERGCLVANSIKDAIDLSFTIE